MTPKLNVPEGSPSAWYTQHHVRARWGEKMARVEVTGVERWAKRKRKRGWKRRWKLKVEEEVELYEGIGRMWRQRWRRKGQGVIRNRKVDEKCCVGYEGWWERWEERGEGE